MSLVEWRAVIEASKGDRVITLSVIIRKRHIVYRRSGFFEHSIFFEHLLPSKAVLNDAWHRTGRIADEIDG
jgi:hypothetical protein